MGYPFTDSKRKAGILKQGVSAVYSAKEPEVIHVMEQTAENAGVPVLEGVTPADYQITKNTGKCIDFHCIMVIIRMIVFLWQQELFIRRKIAASL